ncbi:bacteriohemerythrin [Pararhodospirillum oryzae]|uniref:Hemerythrin n=1 Tax=Pararhodospirillum oryzae TaxID=478448 RepID=A0A512H3G4_9PROT|nr:bacteriohemerythrin [Pararhodospirillum oryzae]GEO79940.1 hemerythrin [Pararhodospirillum oryzae]
MALITWSDKMSVGNATIDGDHRTLLDRLNALHDVVRGNTPRESMPTLFRDLIEYTEYHFATEERLMRLSRFPDMERHKAMHDGLARRLREFEARFQEAPDTFNLLEMFDFVSDWLMRHILREDMKVGTHLKAMPKNGGP